MNFWDFYATHPVLGTIALVVLVVVVDSIGVDVVRTVAVLKGNTVVANKLKDRPPQDEVRRP